jgi:hypothetical protein
MLDLLLKNSGNSTLLPLGESRSFADAGHVLSA